MQVVVIYNPKKKCLEVKGNVRTRPRAYGDGKLMVLKRSHALEMGEVSITKSIFDIIPNVVIVILVSVLSLWIPEIMIALPKSVMPNVFDLK